MTEVSDRQPDDDAEEFYLGDVAIEPPLEEFRRTFEKKVRSFEGDGGEEKRAPYARAFELGETLIRRRSGGEASC